jgi:hypothetical protein
MRVSSFEVYVAGSDFEFLETRFQAIQEFDIIYITI